MTETSLHTEPAAITGPSFGRIVRHATGYSILIAVMLVSPLFVFLPAAIFQCAARNGRRIAWLSLFIGAALAGGLVVAGANAPQITSADAHMSVAYLVALILAVALPSMVVQPMVERGESFARILVTALVFATIGLGATEIAMQAGTGFSPFVEQVASTRVTAAKFITQYEHAGVPADAMGFLRRWMEIGVYCLPAFLLVDVVLVFVMSLVLFGRLRTWRNLLDRKKPAEPSPYLFRNFSLPDWLLFAFIAGGLSPLATGLAQRVSANVLALVAFLYLLQGLAIFRWLLMAAGAGFFGVLFAYVILGVLTLTGIAPLLLSITGLFDSFFDFRKFNRKDS
ncbi:MAG TPA: DUF2232 domain-containing protein, partial [Acidobacteriaceae bacterium]|nr:DUF2232 domain-containing protein [Acidobacteriaceae bacterium]